MHWIYLIHEFHNLSWITEINELFHDILIYWDAPVHMQTASCLCNPHSSTTAKAEEEAARRRRRDGVTPNSVTIVFCDPRRRCCHCLAWTVSHRRIGHANSVQVHSARAHCMSASIQSGNLQPRLLYNLSRNEFVWYEQYNCYIKKIVFIHFLILLNW